MGVKLYIKQLYEILGLHTNPALTIMQGFSFQGKEVSVILEKASAGTKIADDGRIVADYIPLAIVVDPWVLGQLSTPSQPITENNSFCYEDYKAAVAAHIEHSDDEVITDPAEAVKLVCESLLDEVGDGLVHETFDFIVDSPKDLIQSLIVPAAPRKVVVLSESAHIVGLDEKLFNWLPLTASSIEKLPFFDLCIVVDVGLLDDRSMEQLRKELLIKSNIHQTQAVVVYIEEAE